MAAYEEVLILPRGGRLVDFVNFYQVSLYQTVLMSQ